MTPLLTGALAAGGGTGFRTIVVPVLVSLALLTLLALPRVGRVGTCASAFRLLLAAATPVCVALRAILPRDFALSTMLVSIPAAPPARLGMPGFIGDTGRARRDFDGDGRIGEYGSVRELADLGESTCAGGYLASGLLVMPIFCFLTGLWIPTFSLSPSIASLGSSVKSIKKQTCHTLFVSCSLAIWVQR